MTRTPGPILAALSAVLCMQSSVQAQATHHILDVRKHGGLSATYVTADLDSAFDYSDAILNVDSGSGDTDCNVTLDWAQNTTYSSLLGQLIVDSQADFDDTIAEAPGYVRVIKQILWCGTTGTFVGCANVNEETGFIITDSELNYGDAVTGCSIAHELGHTVGNTHVTDTENVMRALCASANVRVTTTQCGRYQEMIDQNGAESLTASEGLAAGSAEVSSGTPEATSTTTREVDLDYTGIPIEMVARGAFIDRVPMGLDQYYGQPDVEVLAEMLSEPYWQPRHSQILSLIGLITDGNDADVDTIIHQGILDEGVVAAAGIALGYVVNRTGSRKALQALFDFASAGGRAEVAGIMGLGLSGHPEAGAMLNTVTTAHADVLADALINYQRITEFGLNEYYRR